MFAGILGIALCALWFMASARIWAYYELRIAQARDSEPVGWDLVKGHLIDKFRRGGEVELADGAYRRPMYARLPTRYVAWLAIAFFFVLYGYIIVANGPWQPS